VNDFPRLICQFPGILRVVRSQEELDEIYRQEWRAMKWGMGVGVAVTAAILAVLIALS
jgi:hypothetical protein